MQNSLMAANVIDGTTGNAVQILGFGPTLIADSNLAAGNDISNATSLAGDVFFGADSTNNLYVGRCNTFTDLGMDNRRLCGHALASASASPVAAALGAPTAANRAVPAIGSRADEIHRARLQALQIRLNR